MKKSRKLRQPNFHFIDTAYIIIPIFPIVPLMLDSACSLQKFLLWFSNDKKRKAVCMLSTFFMYIFMRILYTYYYKEKRRYHSIYTYRVYIYSIHTPNFLYLLAVNLVAKKYSFQHQQTWYSFSIVKGLP